MTVLAGAITKKHGVVLAADSELSYGTWEKEDGFPSKLWVDKENGYVFGGCGLVREIQVLQYHVEWPKFRRGEHELMKFAITEIVPTIRYGIEDHGILNKNKGVESISSTFIMGWGENLIGIYEDFSVVEGIYGRIAMGAGYAEAYGYLGENGPWTKDDVVEAARRATLTAQGVGGDIYYVSTKDLEIKRA
jgi:hypothetical protein